MTLIIAVANDQYAVLASDRRLTRPGGTVVDEETCKITAFACKDAKVMIAYTGLSTTGSGTTGDWVVDVLSEASEGHQSIYDVLERIKGVANAQYAALSAAVGCEFRLELVFAGFVFSDGTVEPKVWRVSNFNGDSSFTICSAGPIRGAGFIELGGTTAGVSQSERLELQRLLALKKPPHGIEMKLVNTVRKAASNSKSSNAVGKQINSCFLTSSPDSPFIATYHSNIPQNTMYSINSVLATSGGKPFVMKDGRLHAGYECPPVSLPKVNPGRLCPCGSGMKYKHCHAKISYPYLPLSQGEELNEPVQSGKKFTVRTYGSYGKG
jgi:hypothetical protein